MTQLSDADIDRVLREPWLVPEPQFSERVLQHAAILPIAPASWLLRTRLLVQWLLIGSGALIGSMEVATFVFGAWSASAAL
jgi:hypothetical protein